MPIVPKHRISNATEEKINRLKSYKSFSSKSAYKDIKDYLVIFIDFEDREELGFDFISYINENTSLNDLNLSVRDKEIVEFSFHDKIEIYSKINHCISYLKNVKFDNYLFENDIYYEKRLLDIFFNNLDKKAQFIYIYVLVLHTDSNNNLCVVYKNNIYTNYTEKEPTLNLQVLRYIIDNFKNLSFVELNRLSENYGNELLKINLNDSKKEIFNKIEELINKSSVKLKKDKLSRRSQVKLILIIIYNYIVNEKKISKQDLIKKTIEYGFNYILDDVEFNHKNINEYSVDLYRIEKNSRLFNDTYKLFNKKLLNYHHSKSFSDNLFIEV